MNSTHILKEEDYLTELRFLSTKREADEILLSMSRNTDYDRTAIDRVMFEDERLVIKYEAFKKNRIKFIVGIIALIVGIVVIQIDATKGYLLSGISFYMTITSFYGILTNRISEAQKMYILN